MTDRLTAAIQRQNALDKHVGRMREIDNMTDTNSLRTGAGYALEVGLYATHKAMTEAADTIDTLRAENERLRACFDWANGAAEEGWLPAQEVRKLRAQLAEAQRDSDRLDWLDKYCTGASDSERYLPRKVYWGGGTHRDVRAAIDAAKGESNA